jgi:hypothetical protein
MDNARHGTTRILIAQVLSQMAYYDVGSIIQESLVHGDPLQHPQTEEYWGNVNPIGERSCYDEGKRCAETLAGRAEDTTCPPRQAAVHWCTMSKQSGRHRGSMAFVGGSPPCVEYNDSI